MLTKGQQINVYKIKKILSEEGTHVCCLTEDPFFHSSVLLKVYPVDFLADGQQRKQLEKELEKLFSLEHPSIALVLDSGFEGQYLYYTTNFHDQTSLLERTLAGVSPEEVLKIIHDLGHALAYATERGVAHGPLTTEKIHYGDEDQLVIADFGIESCLSAFKQNHPVVWTEQQALEDLGQLQLQLLRPSDMDNRGRETEILDGIENAALKKLTERFFASSEDRYHGFSELLEALDPLLDNPPEETRPIVQEKGLQNCDSNGISLQQREQVLPHVRQLIVEKNHYKTLLDEALSEQSKVAGELQQTLQELEQATQLQLESPRKPVAEQRRKIAAWVLVGFVIGLVLSGGYGYSRQQKSPPMASLETGIENSIAVVPKPAEEIVKVVSEKPVPVVPVVTPQPIDQPVAPPETAVIVEEQQEVKGLAKPAPIRVIVEKTQQWWPSGQEFSAATAAPSPLEQPVQKGLSGEEKDQIFTRLMEWAHSWSERNPEKYFSYYSDHYRPAAEKSREEWLQSRKSRLLRPDWIKIEIQDIRMRRLNANRVQVKFQQNYASNTYRDQVWKSLNLIYEDGRWQILLERSLGAIDLVASR